MFWSKPSKWEQITDKTNKVQALENICYEFSEWLRMRTGEGLEPDYLLMQVNALNTLAGLFKELELVEYETEYIRFCYNEGTNSVAIDLK